MPKFIANVSISMNGNYATMTTNRLTFISLNLVDKADLMNAFTKLLNDPSNVKNYQNGSTWNNEQVAKLIETETSKWNAGNRFGDFSIYNSSTNEFIGILHIYPTTDEYSHIGIGHKNSAEIGYIISKPNWGKGYGYELAIAGKKYIQHIASLADTHGTIPNEIVATVHPSNIGSIKILEATLKNQEPLEFTSKYNNQPRLLFFTELKKKPTIDPANSNSKRPQSYL